MFSWLSYAEALDITSDTDSLQVYPQQRCFAGQGGLSGGVAWGMAGSAAVCVAVLLATCLARMQPGSAAVAAFEAAHAATNAASAGADVLVLTILHNVRSWGHGRTFLDYVELLEGLDFPGGQLSVGVLVSERQEFEAVSTAAEASRFANSVADFSVMYADSSERKVPRDQRKVEFFEHTSRRRMIARLRNLAMHSFLKLHHTAVFWVDADVVRVPGVLLKVPSPCPELSWQYVWPFVTGSLCPGMQHMTCCLWSLPHTSLSGHGACTCICMYGSSSSTCGCC